MNQRCFRPPIAEHHKAAELLRNAVKHHAARRYVEAAQCLDAANLAEIRAWTESLWGKESKYVPKSTSVSMRKGKIPDDESKPRMPNKSEIAALHQRDGYHCRYCGLPVIRAAVRKRFCKEYPEAVPWGRTNASQHAAFQSMWAQYDHVEPFSRGQDSSIQNLVVACAGCNFGKMEYSLEEVGLVDPRKNTLTPTDWDGLESFPSLPPRNTEPTL